MPWVRLHGIKDYYGMAWLAQQHPEVHLTFNLVPSLLAQLDDYASGRAQEQWLALTAKPADALEAAEVEFILNEFFRANADTMIRPHPRYHQLWAKRRRGRLTAAQAARHFSADELRDLQVWFTLAWFFPQLLRDDPVLRELVAKSHGFSEDDKAALLARQREVLASIVPMYRQLLEQGTAELSTSPFYHPILPLLCKMERAREALPKLALPRQVADMTDDARTQIARALDAHQAAFGRRPDGMWPSEGAVSPEVVSLAAEAGLRWIATDEGILCRSLGHTLHRDASGLLAEWHTLYQPYRAAAAAGGGGDVAMVFRDRVLSDLIGFRYYHRPPEAAADDFVRRLLAIRDAAGGRDAFVAVVLDGENAWEFYPHSGADFLRALYTRLASTPGIRTATVSEYLHEHPPEAELPRVFSGSWINSDFAVWIGHDEDRRAWELLAQARSFLVAKGGEAPDAAALAQAWEELYIAEGSDWFWWYGDDRSSGADEEFDRLFRLHLRNVYRMMGEAPPEALDEPIARPPQPPAVQPTSFIRPAVDGHPGAFFDWSGAGLYTRERDGGVMENGTAECIQRVHFGFDERHLYLRLDFAPGAAASLPPTARLVVSFSEPRDIALSVPDLRGERLAVHVGTEPSAGARAARAEVFELACPFEELGFRPRETARFAIRLLDDGGLLERVPRAGTLAFEVPTPDFEREMWQV